MIELTVPNEQAGVRLDRYLALALPQFSRSRLQALIRAGDVRLQGKTVRARETVHAGDVVRLTEPPVGRSRRRPRKFRSRFFSRTMICSCSTSRLA